MLHPAQHRRRRHAGQRRHRIRIAQLAHQSDHVGECVPVQRLGRHPQEIGLIEEQLQRPLRHLTLTRQAAIAIKRLAPPRQHQIVDGRIGWPGIKGQNGPRLLWPRIARIDPGDIAHPAKVQKRQRPLRPDPLGTGEMKERGQRRAFAPQSYIRAAEIPDHRQAQTLGQGRTLAQLMRAPPAWLMRQRLPVKPHQRRAPELAQDLQMRALDQRLRLFQILARPLPQSGGQNRLLLSGIATISSWSKGKNRLAIGLDHGRINPIQRGPRHRPQRPEALRLQHGLFLCPPTAYTCRANQAGTSIMTYRPKSDFLNVMMSRGYLADCTDYQGLDEALSAGTVTAYIGYDATAKSLHVGHLLNIMMLRWLQKTGHRPITLMGGGTTKVGDPSFRSDERPLLSPAQIDENIAGMNRVFARYLAYGDGPQDAMMLNNAEWLDGLNYLEFLRDIGRHFSVNRMLSFESVKSRLDREQSLSFLEFNYMILQAYDFLELNRRHGCVLQMGGSDQWGNIVNGIDLTRRVIDHEVFGLTSPLLTTSDGRKMGKSAGGAVWLSGDMLSPYEFWQFWRNTTDADTGRFLKLYTELPIEECDRLGALEGSEINAAKIILANAVTTLLHGAEAAAAAEATAREVFERGGVGDDLPTVEVTAEEVSEGISIVQLIVRAGLAKSGKEAKRLITENGARLDDEPLTDAGLMIDAAALSSPIKLSAGKKRHALVKLSD